MKSSASSINKRATIKKSSTNADSSVKSSSGVSNTVSFTWTPKFDDPYLFIAHDNPQLNNSLKKSMGIMIETKDDKDITHFILGSVLYNGNIECVEGADLFHPRGSQFLVCSQLRGIKSPIKKFPTRPKGDIQEIDIDGLSSECYFILNTIDKVKSFISPCTSRVDVILDPNHTNNWYPYWESARRMAPQFRSQGIGYIRLGDDYSQYGVAFISLDAGQSFLDNGVASIISGDQVNSQVNSNNSTINFNNSLGSNTSPYMPQSSVGRTAQSSLSSTTESNDNTNNVTRSTNPSPVPRTQHRAESKATSKVRRSSTAESNSISEDNRKNEFNSNIDGEQKKMFSVSHPNVLQNIPSDTRFQPVIQQSSNNTSNNATNNTRIRKTAYEEVYQENGNYENTGGTWNDLYDTSEYNTNTNTSQPRYSNNSMSNISSAHNGTNSSNGGNGRVRHRASNRQLLRAESEVSTSSGSSNNPLSPSSNTSTPYTPVSAYTTGDIFGNPNQNQYTSQNTGNVRRSRDSTGDSSRPNHGNESQNMSAEYTTQNRPRRRLSRHSIEESHTNPSYTDDSDNGDNAYSSYNNQNKIRQTCTNSTNTNNNRSSYHHQINQQHIEDQLAPSPDKPVGKYSIRSSPDRSAIGGGRGSSSSGGRGKMNSIDEYEDYNNNGNNNDSTNVTTGNTVVKKSNLRPSRLNRVGSNNDNNALLNTSDNNTYDNNNGHNSIQKSVSRDIQTPNSAISTTSSTGLRTMTTPRVNSTIRPWLITIQDEDNKIKWTDRVTALNQLFQFITNEMLYDECSRNLTSDILDDIIQALSDCFMKQNNPNVLRTGMQCISALSVYTYVYPYTCIPKSARSSTNSTTQLSYGGLSQFQRIILLETIHLLRSNNKLLSDTSRQCLDTLCNSLKYGLRLSVLVQAHMIHDILYGPRTKSAGSTGSNSSSSSTVISSSSAANSDKVLNWLKSVLDIEIHEKIDALSMAYHNNTTSTTTNTTTTRPPSSSLRMMSTNSSSSTSNSNSNGNKDSKDNKDNDGISLLFLNILLHKNNPFLYHRDPVTRDITVEVIACVCIYDIYISLDRDRCNMTATNTSSSNNNSNNNSNTNSMEAYNCRLRELKNIRKKLSIIMTEKGLSMSTASFQTMNTNTDILEASGIFLRLLHPDILVLLTELEKSSSRTFFKLLSIVLPQLVQSIDEFFDPTPRNKVNNIYKNTLKNTDNHMIYSESPHKKSEFFNSRDDYDNAYTTRLSSASSTSTTGGTQKADDVAAMIKNRFSPVDSKDIDLTESKQQKSINNNNNNRLPISNTTQSQSQSQSPTRVSRVRRVGNRTRTSVGGNSYYTTTEENNGRTSTAPTDRVVTDTPTTLRNDFSAPLLPTMNQIMNKNNTGNTVVSTDMKPPLISSFFDTTESSEHTTTGTRQNKENTSSRMQLESTNNNDSQSKMMYGLTHISSIESLPPEEDDNNTDDDANNNNDDDDDDIIGNTKASLKHSSNSSNSQNNKIIGPYHSSHRIEAKNNDDDEDDNILNITTVSLPSSTSFQQVSNMQSSSSSSSSSSLLKNTNTSTTSNFSHNLSPTPSLLAISSKSDLNMTNSVINNRNIHSNSSNNDSSSKKTQKYDLLSDTMSLNSSRITSESKSSLDKDVSTTVRSSRTNLSAKDNQLPLSSSSSLVGQQMLSSSSSSINSSRNMTNDTLDSTMSLGKPTKTGQLLVTTTSRSAMNNDDLLESTMSLGKMTKSGQSNEISTNMTFTSSRPSTGTTRPSIQGTTIKSTQSQSSTIQESKEFNTTQQLEDKLSTYNSSRDIDYLDSTMSLGKSLRSDRSPIDNSILRTTLNLNTYTVSSSPMSRDSRPSTASTTAEAKNTYDNSNSTSTSGSSSYTARGVTSNNLTSSRSMHVDSDAKESYISPILSHATTTTSTPPVSLKKDNSSDYLDSTMSLGKSINSSRGVLNSTVASTTNVSSSRPSTGMGRPPTANSGVVKPSVTNLSDAKISDMGISSSPYSDEKSGYIQPNQSGISPRTPVQNVSNTSTTSKSSTKPPLPLSSSSSSSGLPMSMPKGRTSPTDTLDPLSETMSLSMRSSSPATTTTTTTTTPNNNDMYQSPSGRNSSSMNNSPMRMTDHLSNTSPNINKDRLSSTGSIIVGSSSSSSSSSSRPSTASKVIKSDSSTTVVVVNNDMNTPIRRPSTSQSNYTPTSTTNSTSTQSSYTRPPIDTLSRTQPIKSLTEEQKDDFIRMSKEKSVLSNSQLLKPITSSRDLINGLNENYSSSNSNNNSISSDSRGVGTGTNSAVDSMMTSSKSNVSLSKTISITSPVVLSSTETITNLSKSTTISSSKSNTTDINNTTVKSALYPNIDRPPSSSSTSIRRLSSSSSLTKQT